jgi:sugar phosphate isomerase/epimerase
LLEHVHVQDSDGYADRHWLPGEGSIRWPAVFRALGALGGRPRLNIEVRDKTRLQQCAEFLEDFALAR